MIRMLKQRGTFGAVSTSHALLPALTPPKPTSSHVTAPSTRAPSDLTLELVRLHTTEYNTSLNLGCRFAIRNDSQTEQIRANPTRIRNAS